VWIELEAMPPRVCERRRYCASAQIPARRVGRLASEGQRHGLEKESVSPDAKADRPDRSLSAPDKDRSLWSRLPPRPANGIDSQG